MRNCLIDLVATIQGQLNMLRAISCSLTMTESRESEEFVSGTEEANVNRKDGV